MEWREKEYDQRLLVDVFESLDASEPKIVGALTYLASHDATSNAQYLGPASVEAIAAQIAEAVGPSGPNYVYLFRLAHALREIGGEDPDLIELERAVGALLEARGLAPGDFMGSCPGNHALFWSGREGGPAALAESEAVRAAEKN
ncbi:hypothetical protein H632_c2005p0 [Helicosporidium sp. ATCC 50920]|nr:hypothetical protein H632_c2005p0 [Helicosporidium sp. ATCC 50920]|eukprot:KDD73611.1 hypothetical protein H632_c2005p0 [Helicosporidium sp. ATCC 50920]